MKLSKLIWGLSVLTIVVGVASISRAGDPPVVSYGHQTCTQYQPCSFQIQATNDPTSYSAWPMPLGMILNTQTGLISGSPTYSGQQDANILATNQYGTGNAVLFLTVNSCQNVPIITSPTHAQAMKGHSFSYQITATNNPTHFDAWDLPAGLTVNQSTGLISGTPTVKGTFNIQLRVSNLCAGTATWLTLQVIDGSVIGSAH